MTKGANSFGSTIGAFKSGLEHFDEDDEKEGNIKEETVTIVEKTEPEGSDLGNQVDAQEADV